MDSPFDDIPIIWDPDVARITGAKLPRSLRRGKKVDKDGYLQDIEGVYHAIGGAHRLAHLANEDPRWFFNRFGDRLLPNVKEELDVNIAIHPPLPPSALDVPMPGILQGVSPELVPRNVISLEDHRGRALDPARHQAPGSFAPGDGDPTEPEDSGEADSDGGAFE